MLDFTEQVAYSTLPLVSSPDTQTGSDSPQDISDETYAKAVEHLATMPYRGELTTQQEAAEVYANNVMDMWKDALADPELTAATITKLAPYREALQYVQTEEDSEPV